MSRQLKIVVPKQVSADADSDDALMLACKAGDRAAFARLLERHEAAVFGFAAKYLGNRALAEDVCQDTFTRLWQLRSKYTPQGRLRPFLVKLCFNRCRELARSKRRRLAALERFQRLDITTLEQSADAGLLALENECRVEAAIATLPVRLREAVLMRFYSELRYRDIAELLKRPEGTVRSQVHDALVRLKPKLAEA